VRPASLQLTAPVRERGALSAYQSLSEPPSKLPSGRHLPKDGDGGVRVCYCRRGSRWDRQAEC